MKKRLFLVNYTFITAGREYSEYKLVSIKFEGAMDEELGRQLAEAKVQTWFEGQFTESTLTSVIASTALESVYTKPKLVLASSSGVEITAARARALRRTDLKDMLDIDGLDAGDITQLIEQRGDATDTLVLKNLLPGTMIKELEANGFYVNIVIDHSAKRNYTVIVWEDKK